MSEVNFDLIDIDDLRAECGYDSEIPGVYGCTHPENCAHYCTASNCPLGPLAERDDFKALNREDDYSEGQFVVIYKQQ